ncbi:hypothetical protein SAMN06295910_0569 [Allosphingosinicella indica]|uniref:Uncharacterized protein n=1 Tax=Allosphingosinicella indica TaxID=941907 RepID=A0A1X7G0R2_9SPHN|nr:hypothetical protein SAMN06295910_0569 [Allosphingosinicella indica]
MAASDASALREKDRTNRPIVPAMPNSSDAGIAKTEA